MAVHHLFINYQKANDLFIRKVLNNILTGFGIPIKLVN
jgi:hypothetical protein